MDGCSYYRRRVTTRPVLPYDDRGEGPALFFVHGFLNDASVWTAVIDELETDFRCIAVDLPGHGRSPGNGAGTYGRDLVLGDLRAVMDETECGPVVMVGHSLGGYLSLAMAIEDPHRVTGLGLVGAGPGFRNPDSREQWNDSVRTLAAERDLPEGMEVISMHVDAMVMDRMSEIEVPATVIVGERDKRFMASADVFEKYLNVSGRTVVPDAGHMVHVKGAPGVAAALRASFG